MELCSDGHDEVCYESKKCPACEKIEELGDIVEEKDRYIKELEDREI